MTEREIIERKIFLKRQLIEITEEEIEQLEKSLNVPSFAQEKAVDSVPAI
ncbi:MAG: hypothetical protein JW976_15670 [Syntrophaceae bacterium]|nr:hypothetical protein [Syntrophaceae bacterium]